MITIHGTDLRIPSSPAVSLLTTLQRHRVPIETRCGGRAMCGRCAVRVLRGGEKMNPVSEAEAGRLSAIGAGPQVRLACQSYTRGDLEIEILNPNPAS